MPALHESPEKTQKSSWETKKQNENWHISTILRRVCSVLQHHTSFFKCLSGL